VQRAQRNLPCPGVDTSRRVRVRRWIDGRLYERSVGRHGWVTTDEAPRLLGCARRALFYRIARGTLTPPKVGGIRRTLNRHKRLFVRVGDDTPPVWALKILR